MYMYNIISTLEWQAEMHALGIERVYVYQQLILPFITNSSYLVVITLITFPC